MKSKIIGVFCVLVAVLCIIAGLQYYRYATAVNAYVTALQELLNNDCLQVHLKNGDFTVEYSKFVIAVPVDEKSKDSPLHWIMYKDDIGYSYTLEVNDDALLDYVYSLQQLPTSAELLYSEDNGYYIVPENTYMSFPYGNIFWKVKIALSHHETFVDCSEWFLSAKVTEADLRPLLNKVEWLNDFSLIFANGMSLDKDYLHQYVRRDYSLDVDDIPLDSYISALEDYYTTRGNTINFVTSSGETITTTYKTYGKWVDVVKTETLIRDMLVSHESVTDVMPDIHGFDSDISTYIEVSLDAQHVWHYVNGELCCESDCVTGTKDSRDTPTGVYYVSERINGKYLTGDDYKTWVNKWMRLTNSGVGLHDAYWRSSFGGSIYTYDGSHGCINLPPKYAANLYNEISVGIPTIIY